MSASRRRVMELAYVGTKTLGLEGALALIELPIAAAQVLSEVSGAPVQAYMAIGEEDVAALQAFMRERSAAFEKECEAQP